MAPIYLDSETCGLHGLMVILQWAEGDGPVQIEDLWYKTPLEIAELLEKIAANKDGICGFNLAFDYFHIYKMWTIVKMIPDQNTILIDQVEQVANYEEKARDYPDCLKPYTAMDLFLHARKTHYQSTMDRKDIRIRRIPTALAYPLAKELERRIPLKDIYFARRKDKTIEKWQVVDVKDGFGDIDPDWKDIVVKFKASSALKALAADALGYKPEEILLYRDIEVNKRLWPVELGYAPFAKAIGRPGKWNGAWPEVIQYHVKHWAYFDRARKYAEKDVILTRELYQYFGCPPFGDDDSVLACLVAAVRWRGFKIDTEGMKELRKEVQGRRYKIVGSTKYPIPTAASDVKRYVYEALSEVEKTVLIALNKDGKLSTGKVILEKVAQFKMTCPTCHGEPGDTICDTCNSSGSVKHPAASRAEEVLNARKSDKEDENYEKLLRAGRFHASFKVIGALSSRMSGADRLNAQGIKKTKQVRSKFTLAYDGYVLCGGDFDGFEVTIAEAYFNDSALRKDLLTCEKCKSEMIFDQNKRKYLCTKCGSTEGQTIHGLFGTFLYPPMTYDQIKATKGSENDKYTTSKSAVFSSIYGGEGYTLETKLGIPIDIADAAVLKFNTKYKNVGKRRQEIQNRFGSMRQPGGIGSKVEWHEPDEKIETMYGFPRYFTLENAICKALFQLAQKTPVAWREIKIKVQRRDRLQTAAGAVSSALYAAAFNIQSQNKRAAGNHVIQGTGAQMTKRVQVEIWNIQPPGVHKWLVQPMNVHDEILSVTHPSVVERQAQVVSDTVESFRDKVPLVMMKWKKSMKSWAEK